MADAKPFLLSRPVEAWRLCDPKAMAARQSPAAIEFGFADAKHDILALAEVNARLLAALQVTRGNVASLGPAGALMTVPVYAEYREWLAVLDEVIANATGAAS